MRDIINFLRRIAPRDSFFWFRDGRVLTRNEGIFASAPSPALLLDGVDAPVAETLAALARFQTDPDIELAGESLVLSSARLRVRVRITRGEAPQPPPYTGDWVSCPTNLREKLKLALQFVSDQGDWSSCVHLTTGKITAANGRGLIEIEVPELNLPSSLLPAPSAEFLAAVDPPIEVGAVERKAVFFRWEGGEEVRMQLYGGTSFPEGNMKRAFEMAGPEIPIEITDELRTAVADTAALGDGRVTLTAEEVRSTRQEGEGAAERLHARVALALPGLPADHVSHWSARVMTPMLSCAQRWNPDNYRLRKPSRFEGAGVQGVVMGVR